MNKVVTESESKSVTAHGIFNSNQVVRIIVKVVIVAIFGFMELAIFANATVPWLEGREANKPRIRVEK